MECVVNSKVVSPSIVLIPADLASIAVVRAAVFTALRDRGWDDDGCRRVTLATSEAVANAVEHGSHPGELVEIVHQVTEEDATVRVLDSGRGERWEPPTAPPTAPADAVRGRGLAIIAALADTMEFRPAGRGTELRLDFARA
jgi:serine/threonine-protein kinase RsbW